MPRELGDLIERYDVPGPRYTSYPTVPIWSTAFGAVEHEAALARANPRERLAVYLHLPFCEHRCTFCGCNVVITKTRGRVDAYLDTVEREADLVTNALGTKRTLAALHWGGGTPTFLTVPQLLRAHAIVAERFALADDAEQSIEVDPRVTSIDQLEALRALGFRRVSFGVQDFDPQVQEAIDRVQSVQQTANLVRAARELGFDGINIDLIYGLPHQSEERWAMTLEHVVALDPDRIATYAFAFVPGLKPHQKRLPIADIPRGEAKLRLYLQAKDRLARAGYVPIGMDHFARLGDSLAIAAAEKRLHRNFQGYTTDLPGSLIGLGVTAISDIGGAFMQNEPHLGRYTARVEAGSFATARGLRRNEADELHRELIRRLMCDFAVDLDDIGRTDSFADDLRELQPLVEDGLVKIDGQKVSVTDLGRPFVRNVAMHFDRYRREHVPASRTV